MQRDVIAQLQNLLEQRRIEAGIQLIDNNHCLFDELDPSQAGSGLAIGCLAQWLDVGYPDKRRFHELLLRFPTNARIQLPLVDYVHLRLAESLAAMREENLREALDHLDVALKIGAELDNARLLAVATFWQSRCLRKSGEYGHALEAARRGIEIATAAGLHNIAAVIRTLESWLVFQKGDTQAAVAILQGSETVLRDTDDFITLGNIQSSYGRIALREGRYDHAMQYFDLSIGIFQRRPSLEGYLARSLTNQAQARRLLAMQLRRAIDAKMMRRNSGDAERRSDGASKAAQLERMHELLRQAQEDLKQADVIYKRMDNHHGAGNVDVNLAQIYLDLGDLDEADKRAGEAYDLAATKADYLLMCRARIVQSMVASARFEEQIGDDDDPTRFAQLAHDSAKQAIAFGERTENRRLLAQAYVCFGTTLINGFFQNSEAARTCCAKAESYLDHDRHDALWQEVEVLRAAILRTGLEEPNLRAWSQGLVDGKSLREVVAAFEELLIRKVWEREDRKVARVANQLAVSPKKVRRVLRHLGLLEHTVDVDEAPMSLK